MGYNIIIGCIIAFAVFGFFMAFWNCEEIKDLQKENSDINKKLDDCIQLLVDTKEDNELVFNKFQDEINRLKTNKLSKEDLSLAIEAIVKMYMEE